MEARAKTKVTGWQSPLRSSLPELAVFGEYVRYEGLGVMEGGLHTLAFF